MNFERILTPLIIAVFILSIYQTYNIYADNNSPEKAAQQTGTESISKLPASENTDFIPQGEGTLPIPAAESTALPDIELTTLIHPKEGTYFISIPPDRKRMAAGTDSCRRCHEAQYVQWSQTIHAKQARSFLPSEKAKEEQKIGCESCHGPGSLHIKDPKELLFITSFSPLSKNTREEQNAVCIKCHSNGSLYYWNNGIHGKTITCTECHQVMKNTGTKKLLKMNSVREICYKCHAQKKSQTTHSPHLSQDEANMSCSSCHAPHGSDTPGLLRASSVNENCFICHSDKRGPYLFDHLPVQENCLLCHDAHFSMNRRLLKEREPYLCLECHTNLPVNLPSNIDAHDVLNPKTRFTYNRGCTNCHPMIHGSRHPSGAGLQR